MLSERQTEVSCFCDSNSNNSHGNSNSNSNSNSSRSHNQPQTLHLSSIVTRVFAIRVVDIPPKLQIFPFDRPSTLNFCGHSDLFKFTSILPTFTNTTHIDHFLYLVLSLSGISTCNNLYLIPFFSLPL
jgi:hypothetical protein